MARVGWGGLAAGLVLAAACGTGERPNVLLVTVDTLRPDALGWIGGRNATPTIDALAAGGARFAGAVAPAPLTLPSHASIMTGLVPRRHGVRDNGQTLDAAIPTLAAALQAQGYATGAFVSGYPLRAIFGLDHGFARYDDTLLAGREGWVERPAPETTAAALAWLATAREPWCLWVHYYDPHDPYVRHPELAREGPRAAYDGEVAFVDRALAPLLARAEAARAPLLVVLAGDHAESLGAHGEGAHGFFVYDATVLVPLVVRLPGRIPARAHAAAARLVDVAPTVLDLLALPPLGDVDGTSLVPLLTGKAQAVPEAYVESWEPYLAYGWAPLRAVRTATRKLVEAPVPELYDLAADAGETRNLAAREPEEVARLRAVLAAQEARAPAPSRAAADPAAAARLRALGYLGAGTSAAAPPPGLPDPKERLGERDRLAAAEARLRAGDLTGALAGFEQVLAADGTNRFAVLRAGTALLKLGRLDAAIARLEQAVALDPEQAEARFALADALTRAGRYEPAVVQWEATVRLQPRRTAAWANLGTVLALAGRAGDARTAFAQALALAPDDARLRANVLALDRASAPAPAP